MPLFSLAIICCGSMCFLTVEFLQGSEPEAAAVEQEEAAEVPVPMVLAAPVTNAALVQQAIDRELKIVKTITKLSDEAIAGLNLGLKPFIAAEVAELKKRSNRNRPGSQRTLSPRLVKAIAGAVESLVSDKTLAAEYAQDAEVRTQFEEEGAALALLDVLDKTAGLTTKQLPAVEKLVRKLSREQRLENWAVVPGQIGSVTGKDVASVLSKEQLGYFEELRETLGQGLAVPDTPELPPRANRRENHVKPLRTVASMKTKWLEQELNLTAVQVKKLQLVAKGVIQQAAAKKLDAEEAWISAMQSAEAGSPPDMQAQALAAIDPISLFDTHERWDKLLRSTLTYQQQKDYDAIQKRRAARAQNLIGYSLVQSLRRELTMSGKQLTTTRKLIASSMTGLQDFNMARRPEIFAGLASISEEDFAEAMGAENFATFKPLLDQVKQQFSAAKANENEPPDAAGEKDQ